jgi:hypothetical protein
MRVPHAVAVDHDHVGGTGLVPDLFGEGVLTRSRRDGSSRCFILRAP